MSLSPEGLSKREHNIMSLAQHLLKGTGLDETTIDSQFIFRFDLRWCDWVDRIRSLIWSLMGEDNIQPFERINPLHLRWYLHLQENRYVSVELNIPGNATINAGRGYSPFHKDLSDKLWNARDNETEAKLIWMQMWREANQISKVHSEMEQLGKAYGLIPLEDEIKGYFSEQLESFYNSMLNWVMWGEIPPSFRWEVTQFMENRIKDGSCIISLYKSPIGYWQKQPDDSSIWVQQKIGNTKRMTYSVRIRTWAIYYLTRRGGGKRTEALAISLWNKGFSDEAKENRFREERSRLFLKGSIKRLL